MSGTHAQTPVIGVLSLFAKEDKVTLSLRVLSAVTAVYRYQCLNCRRSKSLKHQLLSGKDDPLATV